MKAALESRGVGTAVSWHALVSTYLPALILAFGVGIAVPAIPTLAKSFNVSFGLASGVVTMFLLGNLLGTIPSGWLIDRFGRRPVLIGGPLLTALTAFLIAGTHSFTMLLVLRFIGGFASQMWIMSRLAAISMGAAANQRGRLVSWMFGMDSTGRLSGPLIGGFIAAAFGARSPFIVYGALALVAVVPTLLFAADTPKRERGADGNGKPKSHFSWKAIAEMVLPRWPYFCVALFAGLTRGPLQADLLHLYAAFAYHLGPRQIGFLATGASLISLPIGFLAGWILDRFGRKRTMVPGFTGVTIAMSLLAAAAYLHLSIYWYVPLFYVCVATQSFTGGSVQTVGADVAPPDGRGTFLGLWRFTGQGGQALSPILFALLADSFNYGAAFTFTAVSAAVVVSMLIFKIPETRTAD